MTAHSPKLRICHLGKYYHPFRGGIETHVQSLAQAQVEAGSAVTVACINHRDQRVSMFGQAGQLKHLRLLSWM